jgi:hypothetical protein
MKKEEYITRHGEEAYEKMLEHKQQWNDSNPGKKAERSREWRKANPEKVKEHTADQSRNGGKRYLKKLKYNITGFRHERNKIRACHRNKWLRYKKIIAPKSQIHHQWVPETSEYKGVALVEKDQHMHGFIDVIQILDGVITVFTEKEIREQEHGK